MTDDHSGSSSVTTAPELRSEIERLRATNRASPDPDIECRLVELRLEAASRLAPTPPTTPTWWSGVEDPFPTVRNEPPEALVSELDVRMLRGAIVHHGCLMVRGLIAPHHVERLCSDIDQTLDAFGRCVERGPGATEPPWFVPCNPPGAEHLAFGRALGWRFAGSVNAADTPRTFFDLVEAFDDAGVPALLSSYLGGDPCVSIDKCTFRRVPATCAGGWHQDSYRFPQGAPVVDVWVALSECGADAPGLEIIPRRVDEVLEVNPSAEVPWIIDAERVYATAGDTPSMSPLFHPGDAIIFDEMLLHRTGGFEGMTKPRYGMDAWFFPEGAYQADEAPALVF